MISINSSIVSYYSTQTNKSIAFFLIDLFSQLSPKIVNTICIQIGDQNTTLLTYFPLVSKSFQMAKIDITKVINRQNTSSRRAKISTKKTIYMLWYVWRHHRFASDLYVNNKNVNSPIDIRAGDIYNNCVAADTF